MRAHAIVAYTYQADIYCPECIEEMFSIEVDDFVFLVSAEQVLDRVARQRGINREDEYSFDSGDFPKVVFASQLEDDEHCGRCGCKILEDC